MTLDVVLFRCLFSLLIGLIIGMERARHGRAAGMRTHILVCLGATITAMTGIYCSGQFGGDAMRLSAQVISGVGFLGAGMIVLKNDNVITGLTTAAGVWATATLGIAVGCGFYWGAGIATMLFFIALTLFAKFERRKKNTEVVYIELDDMTKVNALIDEINKELPSAHAIRIQAPKSACQGHIGIELVMDRRKHIPIEELLKKDGVVFAIES